MGKAPRRSERATAAKPADTKSPDSQRPTWSCSPLTRTEFAHALPSYLSRVNPKYKYFIEYAALHERGVTFANSKTHIKDLVTGSASKGTWDKPSEYEATPQDIIPSDVDSSSDDTGEDDPEYEPPASKTPRSTSKSKAASLFDRALSQAVGDDICYRRDRQTST